METRYSTMSKTLSSSFGLLSMP